MVTFMFALGFKFCYNNLNSKIGKRVEGNYGNRSRKSKFSRNVTNS